MFIRLIKNLFSSNFLKCLIFCLINLAFFFSVFHRGGISLQAHIVFAGLIGAAGIVFLSTGFPTRLPKYFVRRAGQVGNDKGGMRMADIFLIIFSIFFLFSFFFSWTRNYGLMEVVEIFGGISIFFIISKGFFEKLWVERFLKSFMALATLSTLIGFYAYLTKPFDRFAGTFQDFRDSFSAFPNGYADFLLLLLPFMAWMFFKCHSEWRDSKMKNLNALQGVRSFLGVRMTFWALVFVLNLSGFVLAESKGAMIAGLGMIGLVLIAGALNFFQKKRFGLLDSGSKSGMTERKNDMFIFIFICLFAFAFASRVQHYHELKFPEQNLDNLSDEQIADIEQNVSESSRKDFWKGSIQMMKSNDYSYLFGYGPYSFKFIYPQYQAKLLAISDHPHNIFLKYFVENGVVATLSFIIFLILVFSLSFSRMRESSHIHAIAFISLAGFIAHQLIDYNLNFTSNVILFWFLIGLFAQKKEKSGKKKVDNKFSINTFFFFLFSFFLLTWSLHDGYYSYLFQKARAFDQAGDFKNAYIYYEKSENIWFKRDYNLSFAKLLASSNIPANLDEAFDVLWNSLRLNNQDARIFNELGLIYLNLNYSNSNLDEANKEFNIATSRDPKNNLEYYYNFTRTAQNEILNLSEESDKNYRLLLKEILNEYLSNLRLNAYNTILTENPRYAILIAEEILKKLNIDCANQKNDFCDLRDKLIETKKIEEEKIEKIL